MNLKLAKPPVLGSKNDWEQWYMKLWDRVSHDIQTVSDAAASIGATKDYVAITALTASRTLTLPPTNRVPDGAMILFVDHSGNAGTYPVTIDGNGSETVNGIANTILCTPYGWKILIKYGGAWFAYPIGFMGCRASRSTALTVPNNTLTIIDYATVTWDAYSMITTGASWKATIKQSGFYDIKASITYNGDPMVAGTIIYLDTYKNGVKVSRIAQWEFEASVTKGIELSGVDTILLAKDDEINFRTIHNIGGTRYTIANGTENFCSICLRAA